MSTLLSNDFTHSHRPPVRAYRGRPQDNSVPQIDSAGHCRRMYGLKDLLDTRYECNRYWDTNVESAKEPKPRSGGLSSSPVTIPDNVGVSLPVLSFSSGSIFPCDSLRSGPTNTFNQNHFNSQSPVNDIRIRSVTHPNSPYVPWSEHQRQWAFSSAETLGVEEVVTSSSHKKWDKATFTGPALDSSRRGTLRCRVLGPIVKCFRLLCKPPMHPTSPTAQKDLIALSRFESATSLSSVQTNSLEDWLAERRRELSLAEDGFSLHNQQTSSCTNDSLPQGPPGIVDGPPSIQPTAFNFSLDCIPSPSPTIISFPCTSR